MAERKLPKPISRNEQQSIINYLKDIILLQSHFGLDIAVIFARPLELKQGINDAFKNKDGLTHSGDFCLSNIKNKVYKKILTILLDHNLLMTTLNNCMI